MRKLNLKLVYVFRLFYKKRGEDNKIKALTLLSVFLLSLFIFLSSALNFYFESTFVIGIIKSKTPLILFAPFFTAFFLLLGKLFHWKGNFKEIKQNIIGLQKRGKMLSVFLVLLSVTMLVLSFFLII